MYTMIQSLQTRWLLAEQAMVIGISLVIAELFYKFHSFTLECVAFLATWYVLDRGAHLLRSFFERSR